MNALPAGSTWNVTKTSGRALLNAADQVASDNAAALNSAVQAIDSNWNTLPQAVRAWIFAQVILRRWAKGA
jgi:hypothetical protein